VCESGVLRRIFWSKREEVTREWGKLHEEEQLFLHLTQNFSDNE
jgi:hypothetical protein